MTDGLVLFPKSTLASGPTAFDWWRLEASRCGINLNVAFFEDLMLRYDAGHASAYVDGMPLPGQAFAACDAIGAHEFIVKQNDGSRGVNVFLVRSKGEYDSALGILGAKAMLQRYVSSSCGRDLRVWTVGERAVGCVLRHSDSSFLSNYSQGGSADPYALSVEAADLAVKAARSLGLEFAGIDLLFTPGGGFTVCEVNGNAGFRTLSSLDRNSSILRNLFEYITDRYA